MTRSAEAVEAAFEAGINFFFLSGDLHWPLYEANRVGLARLFRRPGVRDQLVVCVASYVAQPPFCYAPFAEVVGHVSGLGRVDIASMGGAYRHNFAERLPVFEGLRQAGFAGVTAIAANFHERSTALTAVQAKSVDLSFIRMNPVHPGALKDYFPGLPLEAAPTFAFKTSFGAMTEAELRYVGITDDQWFPTVGDQYRYALSEPRLSGLLFSVETPEQLAGIDEAMAAGPLDGEECDYLETLSRLVIKGA